MRRFRFNSIGVGMALSFILLISVIVLFVSIVSYQFTVKDAQNLSTSYTQQLLRGVNTAIDSYISNMKSMTQLVVGNRDVRRLMGMYVQNHGRPTSYLEDQALEELKAGVSSYLKVVAGTRNDITNIAVISKHRDAVFASAGKQVNPASEFYLSDWFLRPLSYKDEIVISPSHVQNFVDGEYPWVISFSKAITDISTGEIVGVLLVDLNFGAIEEICESAQLGKSGYIYLVDGKKNLIYHQQQQLVYAGIKQEPVDEILKMPGDIFTNQQTQKLYIRQYSQQTGWNAVGVVNIDELSSNRLEIVRFYVTLAIICITMAALVAAIISATVTQPIKELEQTMHLVEEGDLSVRANLATGNEIGQLGATFNHMIDKTRDLMDAAVAGEEEKRKSEIRALQAQINPHFLYNTLDTIIWMAASGQNDEVVEVTSALAKLFRTSISKGETYAPLANEVENIKSYLTIQKMRYKDRLTFSIHIPAKLLEYDAPKLILQPIVENALYHGIKMNPKGGHITIGGRQQEHRMILTVEDDGVGMSSEQTELLLTPKSKSERGIGVWNVHRRLKLSFGEEYGLAYQSKPGEGTLVEITLPMLDSGEVFLEQSDAMEEKLSEGKKAYE